MISIQLLPGRPEGLNLEGAVLRQQKRLQAKTSPGHRYLKQPTVTRIPGVAPRGPRARTTLAEGVRYTT